MRVGAETYPTPIKVDGEETLLKADLAYAIIKVKYACLRNEIIFWADIICIYSDRTAMKHLGNLRFKPRFSEGFEFVSKRKKRYSALSRSLDSQFAEASLGPPGSQ